jgi:L-fuculose-phosphate aldolase
MVRRNEQQLRQEIVRVGRLMYDKGFISSSEGNLSSRLAPGRILITPAGLHKGFLEVDQLLVVDPGGRRLGPATAANRHLKPTSELPMHLEAYRLRGDIGAVVHAHPPITIALSVAGIPLADCLIPEVIVMLGLIPTSAYATPSSDENVRAIHDLIVNHDALVLQRHGSLTVGQDPMEAFMRLEVVEQNARISFMLAQLGVHHPLPAEEVRKLLRMRREMGLSRPGESDEFCEVCGVCHTGNDHAPTLRPGAARLPAPEEEPMVTGPQALPPIRPRTISEDEVQAMVAQVLRRTMSSE